MPQLSLALELQCRHMRVSHNHGYVPSIAISRTGYAQDDGALRAISDSEEDDSGSDYKPSPKKKAAPKAKTAAATARPSIKPFLEKEKKEKKGPAAPKPAAAAAPKPKAPAVKRTLAKKEPAAKKPAAKVIQG